MSFIKCEGFTPTHILHAPASSISNNRLTEAVTEQSAAKTPMKRKASPQESAGLIEYL